jgi:cytoskeletal protein RodZ
VKNLKELGNYLKEARENNGVSIDEAADDLKIDKFLLESLEEGNIRAFKDVLGIRDIVKVYSKYLGLDPEEVIEEFNDFLFEHTSRISLDDILEAEKKAKEPVQKIASPYTYHIKTKKKIKLSKLGLVFFWMLMVAVLIGFVFIISRPNKEKVVTELMIGSVVR